MAEAAACLATSACRVAARPRAEPGSGRALHEPPSAGLPVWQARPFAPLANGTAAAHAAFSAPPQHEMFFWMIAQERFEREQASLPKVLQACSAAHGFDAEGMRAFVETLEIPEDAKQRLRALTPASYIGAAAALAAEC